MMTRICGLVVVLAATTAAQAQMRITEYMYDSTDGGSEFIEFTNVGPFAINMAGWSYDDDSNLPGTIDLSGFGVVVPGQSVILAEAPAGLMDAYWGLGGSVVIIGDNSANLSRNDRINLFDSSNTLVDALDYGDQNFAGTFRARDISVSPTVAALGTNDIFSWFTSTVGDVNNAFQAPLPGANIASPGHFTIVPEPGTMVLLGLGVAGLIRRRR